MPEDRAINQNQQLGTEGSAKSSGKAAWQTPQLTVSTVDELTKNSNVASLDGGVGTS
jgi:hypothetical protein